MRAIHYTLIAIAVACAILLCLMVREVRAQSMCGPYADFVKALNEKYHETSAGKGMSGSSSVVIELFTSEETFTVLATITATGNTCIIAAGKGWAPVAPHTIGEDL